MWVSLLESKIYTTIKTRASKTLKNKFPSITFTEEEENLTIDSSFPTVLIYFKSGGEQAQDLVGTEINMVECIATVDVTVNKEQDRQGATMVMDTLIDEFKKLGFEVTMMPQFMATGNNTKRKVAKVKRVIGSGDVL